MALNLSGWTISHVGASGHGCVMNFDSRYNGKNWNNRVKLAHIQNRPSWELYAEFASTMNWQTDADYPFGAEIHDNDNFFRVDFPNKYSMRAGIQYGRPGSYGPIPSGLGKHRVRVVLLDRSGRPLLAQSGEYWIDP